MEEKGKEETTACRCPYCDEELALCADLPVTCQPCSVVIVSCSACGGPVREGSDTCPSCGGRP